MSRSPHLEFIRDTWHGVFYFPTIDEAGHATYRRKRISLAVKGKTNKRRAQKALTQLEREILIEGKTSNTDTLLPSTVKELAAIYLQSAQADVRRRTMQIYTSAVKTFVSLYGDLQTNEISMMHIERFKELLRTKYSITSVNMYFRAVKTMFAYGSRLDPSFRNPCAGVKVLRTDPKGFPPYITMEEFQQVIDILTEKSKGLRYGSSYIHQILVLSLAMYAGLRRGEAQNLRWEHVDLQRMEIRVAITDTFVTKTGRERTVPIISKLGILLRSLPQSGKYVVTETDTPPNDTYATKVWNRVRNLTNPPIQIPYHGLRHSFATWLSSQPGVSLKTVSEILGHTNIQTTMIYSHIQQSDLDHIKIL